MGVRRSSLYCIDILTLTYGGVGYNLGTWDASNVNNVGFVAYLLNHYFPNVPTAPAARGQQPAGRGGAGGHLVLQ